MAAICRRSAGKLTGGLDDARGAERLNQSGCCEAQQADTFILVGSARDGRISAPTACLVDPSMASSDIEATACGLELSQYVHS